MMKELKDYPGYYADDSGKIYSLKSGKLKEKKQSPKTHGYLYVTLYHNGKRYYLRVHRLIAGAFIDNPTNLPEVNHKDENKINNRADNLEWCTSHDNKMYGTRRERIAYKVSDPNRPRKNNTSGRKGVFKTPYNTWQACLNRTYLGTYKTFDEAVKAREMAEKEMYGRTYNS